MPRRAYRYVLLASLILAAVRPGLSRAAPAAEGALVFAAWSRVVIDAAGVVGQHLSLAVQPTTGKPHIAYYDLSQTNLKLAFPVALGGDCGPGNTWSCNSLNFINSDDFGRWPSIAFNAGGQWGIAYLASFSAQTAYRGLPAPSASELFWTPIDESGGLNSSVFNEDGVAEVAWGTIISDSLYVRYAHYVGTAGNCGAGKWSCVTVDELTAENFSTGLSLAKVDAVSPNTMIAYRGDSGGLEIAAHPALLGTANCGVVGLVATWWCFLIDSSVSLGAVSLATEGGNQLHIAYVDRQEEKLKYAHFTPGDGNCGGGDWRCIVVDDAYLEAGGYGVSLALWDGAPAIAYSGKDQQGRSVVKVAREQTGGNCGRLPPLDVPTWQCDVVDDGLRLNGYHDVGNAVALAFSPSGRAYIAYHDATDGDLLLAEQMYRLPLPLVRRN